MIEMILSGLILTVMLWFAFESNAMVSEKRERQRKGLTDYYDNPIEKDK